MKNLLAVLFILVMITFESNAQSSDDTYSLTVNLTGLQKEKGAVMVGLYNVEGKWLSENFAGEESTISMGTAQVTFTNLPKGEYAISTFHDIDGDGELGSNALGIPNEPYAFSNNAKGLFGPASFKDSKFEVNSNTEIVIKF